MSASGLAITVNEVDPILCLRCGCVIQPDQPRSYRFKNSDEIPGALQAYKIQQHFSVDDCMVALRRKEVDDHSA